MLEEQRAVEPPLWHIICADYFNADRVLDCEVEGIHYGVSQEDFILETGNNPTAQGQHTKLPMNPILYKPRWDLIDLNKYRAHDWHAKGYPSRSPYGVLYTSVSCPFKCKFCFSKDFYPVPYTERPLKDIFADLEYFREQGVTHIKIIDELFVLRTDRVKKICSYIINSCYTFNIWCYARIDTVDTELLHIMKLAGINWVCYGIESGNERIRKEVGKGKFTNEYIRKVVQQTKDAGIKVLGNFMFGFENDTIQTMHDTYDLATEFQCEHINFYCLADKNVNQLSKDFLPKSTKTLTPREVLEFRDNAFSEYTGSPKLEREINPFETGVNYNCG